MSELNEDVLYLIFEQLKDNKNTLVSCILVNKAWCKIIIPILWKNPWKFLKKENEKLLLDVIISHLSNLSRNKIEENKLLTISYQRPSFNYISFCKHLNLNEIQKLVSRFYRKSLLKTLNEILSLFINENMKFTHLYIHQKFDKINLINGAESCFSGVEFLSCSTKISDNILSKLVKTCKSIKELELTVRTKNNNYGIVTLIEAQKKLFNVSIISLYNNYSFYSTLKNSLVRHANSIQYFKVTEQPTSDILSSFVNLKGLELGNNHLNMEWNCLKNLSLPFLQTLSTILVPAQALTDLIKNTNGSLFEINIDHSCNNEVENKRIIQTIYRNCPNLKYLKLLVRNNNITELKALLINCQYLNGLYILTYDDYDDYDGQFNWDKLFKILTESSSTSLFKFIFRFSNLPKLESLKLFFDNWKGRHPMLLQFNYARNIDLELIERYKTEGVINKFNSRWFFEDLEWTL